MTRVCCPGCRVRFTRAMEASLTECPSCGGQLAPRPNELGYQLFDAPQPQPLLVQALVASRRPAPETSA
jgi:hypothetical protein